MFRNVHDVHHVHLIFGVIGHGIGCVIIKQIIEMLRKSNLECSLRNLTQPCAFQDVGEPLVRGAKG
jgi:hypothetical protein